MQCHRLCIWKLSWPNLHLSVQDRWPGLTFCLATVQRNRIPQLCHWKERLWDEKVVLLFLTQTFFWRKSGLQFDEVHPSLKNMHEPTDCHEHIMLVQMWKMRIQGADNLKPHKTFLIQRTRSWQSDILLWLLTQAHLQTNGDMCPWSTTSRATSTEQLEWMWIMTIAN